MSDSFRMLCSKYNNLTQKNQLKLKNAKQIMFSRTLCIFLFTLSVTVAVIVTFLPVFQGGQARIGLLTLDLGVSLDVLTFGLAHRFTDSSGEGKKEFDVDARKVPIAEQFSFPCSSLYGQKAKKSNPYVEFQEQTTVHVSSSGSGDTLLGQNPPDVSGTQLSLKPRRQKPTRDLTVEALASLHLGRERLEQGNLDKARKLFEHAVALDPTHPDVINDYGEFLESFQKDVVSAQHMYCRALSLSPSHSKALSNHKRTLPLVQELDQNRFNRIEKKREFLFQIPETHPGLKRIKKESYFKHIHHTTAIEGNTFTLNQARALIETRMAIGGKSIIEHNEIIGMDSALSYVNSSLLHRIGSITVTDILEIHKRVLGFVDPVEGGKFRSTQVFVGDHIPPTAASIEEHMEEFVLWLNSDDAISLHPIEFAALAHYRLVYIHPFYDGNGRTSRLLMNLILMQAGYPPVTIKKQAKHEYYQYLQAGNNGDIRPFIRFIARCTEQTIDEYLWALSDKPNTTFPELSSAEDDGRTIILENTNSRQP